MYTQQDLQSTFGRALDTWRHVFQAFHMSNITTCFSLSSAGDFWMNFKLPKYSDLQCFWAPKSMQQLSPSLYKVSKAKEGLTLEGWLSVPYSTLAFCEITLICSRVNHSFLMNETKPQSWTLDDCANFIPLISRGTKQWGRFLIAICLTSVLGWQADDSGRHPQGLYNSG